MTEKQRQTQVNNYHMLKGLHNAFGSDPDWILNKRNQNSIADQIINWGTKTGDFNAGHYSLEALKAIYTAKSFGSYKDENGKTQTVKNEKDHTVKTKTLAIMVWDKLGGFNSPDDYINYLLDHVYILNMTRFENKHQDAKNIGNPIDRYKSIGIDFVYKKVKQFKWASIHSFEDMLKYFEMISVEEWLNEAV